MQRAAKKAAPTRGERLEASEGPQNRTGPPRRRRGIVFTLIGVASLLAFLSVFAIWANRQLLETDTWTDTSTKLLEDEEIRTQVSYFMVDTLYANVDVQAELQQALPPRLQPLAGPAAAGLRELTLRLADQALQRPRVQQLWEDANRAMHQQLIDVVEHGGDENVNLDIGTIVGQLGQQLGVDVAGKVPPGAAQIEVLPHDNLSAIQKAVKVLRGLAIVLTLVALALFGLAIYLAGGWRREALRSIGFAFIVIGVLVLVGRKLAGDAVVSSLTSTEASKPAVTNTWSIATSLLAAQGGAMIFYGFFIVIGAWLSGPMGFARSARRAITPVLERRVVAYSVFGLILLLLFVWSPTPGFQRLPTALLLIALSIVGLEFLRHKAIKDFPNETWEAGTERWRRGLESVFSRRSADVDG
jgi:hypothetical protein